MQIMANSSLVWKIPGFSLTPGQKYNLKIVSVSKGEKSRLSEREILFGEI